MSSEIKSLEENIGAFADQSENLVTHHKGKFVIFYNGCLEGSFDTFHSATEHAIADFGNGPYLIRQVGAPKIVRLPASVAYCPIHAYS